MSDFPTVHDEATETPMWVPVVGIGVLVLAALSAIVRSTIDEVTDPKDPAVLAAPAAEDPGAGPGQAPPSGEEPLMPNPQEALRRFLAGEME